VAVAAAAAAAAAAAVTQVPAAAVLGSGSAACTAASVQLQAPQDVLDILGLHSVTSVGKVFSKICQQHCQTCWLGAARFRLLLHL
jgi:hypothetical protein